MTCICIRNHKTKSECFWKIRVKVRQRLTELFGMGSSYLDLVSITLTYAKEDTYRCSSISRSYDTTELQYFRSVLEGFHGRLIESYSYLSNDIYQMEDIHRLCVWYLEKRIRD
jgi:hypothetical protein